VPHRVAGQRVQFVVWTGLREHLGIPRRDAATAFSLERTSDDRGATSF
jgi:hypothetical protein